FRIEGASSSVVTFGCVTSLTADFESAPRTAKIAISVIIELTKSVADEGEKPLCNSPVMFNAAIKPPNLHIP
ncbi:hypothetical protein ABFV54_28685, partial [Pseudomonas syringae]|uniref:hypothetical protein n=1 Tax=Pseudomonas syringae TaxID=317 RepID=UPI0034D6F286